MKIGLLLAPVALLLATQAQAAPPAKAVLLDFSSEALIESDAAKAMLGEGIPAKVWKVYPANRWGFVSQVQGGMTSAGMCVVTARVMMVPLTPTTKAVLFRPSKIATTFDAQAGSNAERCRELAKAKLHEAVESVVSSLVKS